METVSFVDRLRTRLRANPVVAAVIAIGLVVVWTATFTDAVRKLRALWPAPAPAAVAGRWQSDVIQAGGGKPDFRYEFTLQPQGTRLVGSARRVMPFCEGSRESGLCEGHGRTLALSDGTVDAQGATFGVDWGELPGTEPWTWVRVKERFRGSLVDGKLRFLAEDDQRNPPREFVATRVADAS